MTAPAPGYRFARSPKWILSHLLVASLVVVMIIAGFWQIDRHGQRRDRNDVIEARSALAPVPLEGIAPIGSSFDVGEQEQYRRVAVTGEYQPDDEVLIRNRSLDGAPGWWVLTPLVTVDGFAVAVNRGWIPLSYQPDQVRPATEAPSGTVTVVGWVQPARKAEGFQRDDPIDGRLLSLGRPDVERLAQQLSYDLSPVVLQIDPASVADGVLPVPIPLPALDAGPHLSYAAQWFIFTTIALVGYPLVLRRVASGRGGSTPYDDDPYENLSRLPRPER